MDMTLIGCLYVQRSGYHQINGFVPNLNALDVKVLFANEILRQFLNL